MRRVVTTQLQAADGAAAATVDTYFAKIVKYIPADVVGAWVAVTGLISSASGVPTAELLWGAFVVGVVVTALWTLRTTAVPGLPPARTQTLIATGAFVVWVFALGGPFATLSWYVPLYGSLALILYTLVVPLINPPEG